MTDSNERKLTLYGLAYSVYTRIVRLVLEEKTLPYRLIDTDVFADDFDHTTHRQRHPFGKIPALQHDALSLYETSAICRYLDEAFAGVSLQPVSAADRGLMHQLIGLLDSYAYQPMVWGVFVELVVKPLESQATDADRVDASLAQSDLVLQELEKQLNRGTTFLVGRQLSLADLHAAPMLLYFAKTAPGAMRLRAHPRLSAWLEHMQHRNSVQTTRSIYD